MNRRPPAFLERFVGRLIPAASREHVLGDLSERYTSPSQYVLDAIRTIPFVLGSHVRRSRALTAWVAGAGPLQVAMVPIFFGVLHASIQLERGVQATGWFMVALVLFLLCFCVFFYRPIAAADVDADSARKRTLLHRIAKVKRHLQVSAVPGAGLGAMPFLQIAAARMTHRATPEFDGRLIAYSFALVVLALCLCVMEREQYRRQLRQLHQQLEQV